MTPISSRDTNHGISAHVSVPMETFTGACTQGKRTSKLTKSSLFTDSGIQLDSGEFLDVDIIITATGLKLQIGGGIRITVDQKPYNLSEKSLWRGIMLDNLPNAALVIGYTNASWTLGADVTGIFICRLFKFLEREGFWTAFPRTQDGLPLRRRKILHLSSTYVTEAEKNLPKVADMGPWKARSNYFSDLIFANHGKLDESLELVKKPHWETDKDYM